MIYKMLVLRGSLSCLIERFTMNTIVLLAAIAIITYLIVEVLVHCFNNAWVSILFEQSERHAERYVWQIEQAKKETKKGRSMSECKMPECSECKGYGRIYKKVQRNFNVYYVPVCKGEGYETSSIDTGLERTDIQLSHS